MSDAGPRVLPPVVKTVAVSSSVEAAFARFTEHMGAWWPLATHSAGKHAAETVTMEPRTGGRIVERRTDGVTCDWGRVTVWDPPTRVEFTWHPGQEPETAQTVAVRFRPGTDGTDVELVHRGWERLGIVATLVRAQYEQGWDLVLGRYANV